MPNVLQHTNFNQTELRNPVLQNLSAAPSSPTRGQTYFDTTLNKAGTYNGASWDYVTSAGVTSVTGTAPISSSGGTTPTLSIAPATGSTPGSMSASDKSKLDAATAINTASAIVQRDSSGNLAAGTVTANLTGTASNASNLNNQAPSFYLARVNHTGTQAAATISDFDAQVNTHRLDQLTAPTSNVNLNSNRIINLSDPTSAQDAATKAYVDATATGLDVKASARVATTANLSLTAPGASIDGVTLVSGDRVLVKNQTTASQNGLYAWNGASATMTRTTDADNSPGSEVTSGMFVYVEEGTTNGTSGFILTTTGTITLGTTALTFAQFSKAGQVLDGAGLAYTGNTLNVGAGTGIVVNADNVAIDTSLVPRKFQQNIGDGTSTSLAVTHNLGTRDIVWNVYVNSGNYEAVIPDVQMTSANVATFIFATAPTANQYRVAIQG